MLENMDCVTHIKRYGVHNDAVRKWVDMDRASSNSSGLCIASLALVWDVVYTAVCIIYFLFLVKFK